MSALISPPMNVTAPASTGAGNPSVRAVCEPLVAPVKPTLTVTPVEIPPITGGGTSASATDRNIVTVAGNGIVTKIQAAVGNEAVMIHIPRGEKGPKEKGWQNKTIECMSDPAYLARLEKGNIGVLLGKPSGNLCAIDVDDDDALMAFIELNPRLEQTLITRGARGAQIWVIVIGEAPPKTTKLMTTTGQAFGEWRGDGGQSVIHGLHPTGKEYEWLSPGPVVQIAFGEIVWGKDLKLPWGNRAYLELVQEVGDPISGKSPNVSFFAELFRQRNILSVFDGRLCVYAPDSGLWRVLRGPESTKMIWDFTRKLLDELERSDLKNGLKTANIDEIGKILLSHADSLCDGKDGDLIHVKNGMVNLAVSPLVLELFAPEYGSRHRIEIDYVAGAECPKFKAWLEASRRPEDVPLFQEWAGAVLLGPNLSQCIMLLHGDSGCGKSTLIKIVEKIVGEVFVGQLRVSQLGSRFETRNYGQKVILTAKDVGPGFLCDKNAGALKSLTGGDLMSAERKTENDELQFHGDLHVAIISNAEQQLRVEGDADAWVRRLLSIHMKRPEGFVSVADFIDVILREEGLGILAWVIAGAVRHRANGFKYSLTESQEATINRIVNAADGVRLFVDRCLVVDEGGPNPVTMGDLHSAYEKFAKEYDFDCPKKQVFGERIKPLILAQYGLHQSHDIPTPSPFLKVGGVSRGYRGLIIVKGDAT